MRQYIQHLWEQNIQLVFVQKVYTAFVGMIYTAFMGTEYIAFVGTAFHVTRRDNGYDSLMWIDIYMCYIVLDI